MKKKKLIIAKVHKNKYSGQKLITIPAKEYSIQKGDYVIIEKLNEEEIKSEFGFK